MKYSYTYSTILVFGMSISSHIFAGGGIGGGGPPARETLDQLLMLRTDAAAGLFTTPTGDIALAIKSELAPSLRLTKSASTQALNVSETDLSILRSIRTIDAMQVRDKSPEIIKSYRIEDGDDQGEVILKDRRQFMREALDLK